MLNSITKLSAVGGIFLVFCGVLKQIVFYSAFKIDIVDYLTFSEIVTSFLDDLNVLLIIILTMIIQSALAIGFLTWKTKLRIDDLIVRLLRFGYVHKWKYAAFFAFCTAVLAALVVFQVWRLNYFNIYALVGLVLQLLTYVFLRWDEERDEPLITDQVAVGSGVASAIVGIFLLAQLDIGNLERRFDNVTIQTVDGVRISCDSRSKLIFLGKTDGYVFVYDKNKLTSSIIPSSRIKLIRLK